MSWACSPQPRGRQPYLPRRGRELDGQPDDFNVPSSGMVWTGPANWSSRAKRFDFNDLGAHIREDLRTERPKDKAGEVKHPYTVERFERTAQSLRALPPQVLAFGFERRNTGRKMVAITSWHGGVFLPSPERSCGMHDNRLLYHSLIRVAKRS